MPALVDTTIRLLSQEPLAERVAAARLYELADVLDEAGFAYLEVSGGGCFDAAVRRGVESPWERIRSIKARCSTPLGMALRGRFLVGTRPLGRDLVRRFIESAAASGIDVFRIHDPLNDLGNLREAADAIRAAEKELTVGLVHTPGPAGQTDVMLERAHGLAELGAARVVVHDPAGSLHPGQAGELMAQMADASGLPVGFHGQGSGGAALASALEAVRAGPCLLPLAPAPRPPGGGRGAPRRITAPPPASWRGSTPTCAPTPPPTGSTRCSRSSRASGRSAVGHRSHPRSDRCSAPRRCCTSSRRSAGGSS